MTFADALNTYLQEADCNAAELAEASGVAKSTISRYLSGQRTPATDGTALPQLAAGLASLARKGGHALDEKEVAASLAAALGANEEYGMLAERLRLLLDTFGVARNRLARTLDFDPSYISRILAGQRRPADIPTFIDGIASYIARNHGDANGVALAADLTGVPAEDLRTPSGMANAIKAYLGTDSTSTPEKGGIESFLERLDEFDLDSFLQEVHFNDIKVPTAPFQLPTTKTYTGIEEMKQAELDFLKAAVLSKATDDVILYSDMPLGEMAQDEEFPKQVMMGMAMLIRKGIHLQNIHDVHRPVNELFMGLEGWIPVYMTGQVTPYYLPRPTNATFLHFLRSAGKVAVTGEAIAGNQGGGRYVVTKNAADVAYVRQRAQELLAHAKPLLRVFKDGDEAKLQAARARLEKHAASEPIEVGGGTFANMTIQVWPKSHALIEKAGNPKVTFLVEYPALVDALERYEPTLFYS